MKRLFAFSLSEVLITISIIGTIAALTMPGAIANYDKQVSGTKLNRFYSQMKYAQSEYMRKKNMVYADFKIPNSVSHAWWESTIGGMMTSLNKINNTPCYSQIDGTAYCIQSGGPSKLRIYFFTEQKYLKNSLTSCKIDKKCAGKHMFYMEINEGLLGAGNSEYANLSRAELLEYCSGSINSHWGACTKLIQRDNWKIAEDYPWRRY